MSLRYFLTLSVALCATLHILLIPLVVYPGGPLVSMPFDPAEYRILAENILAGSGFSTSVEPPYAPQVLRTPGYPIFLAATFFIDPTGYVAILLQQFLLIGAAFLVGLIVLRHTGYPTLSLGAALLILIEPHLFVLSMNTVTETLFLFLFTLAFFILTNLKGTCTHLILYGAILASLLLVRPSAVLIVPFFIIGAYMRTKSVRASGEVLLCVTLLVLPWIMYVHTVSGSFTLSTAPEFNIVYGLGNSQEKNKLLETISRSGDSGQHITVGAYTAAYAPFLEELSRDVYARRGASGFIAAQIQCSPKVWFGHYYQLFLQKLKVSHPTALVLAGFFDMLMSWLLLMITLAGFYVSVVYPPWRLYAVVLGGCLFVTTFVNLCVADTRMQVAVLSSIAILGSIAVVGFLKRKTIL